MGLFPKPVEPRIEIIYGGVVVYARQIGPYYGNIFSVKG